MPGKPMAAKYIKRARPPADLTRKRFLAGAVIFFTGQAISLTIPLVLMTGLSANLKTAASAVLFFVIPSMFTLSSIVVLGRPGFSYLKGLIFRRLRWYNLKHTNMHRKAP